MKYWYILLLAVAMVFGSCEKEKYDVSDVRVEISNQDCCECADGKYIEVQFENSEKSNITIAVVEVTFRDCYGRTYFHRWDFENSTISPGLAPGGEFTSNCLRMPLSQTGEFCPADCTIFFESYKIVRSF